MAVALSAFVLPASASALSTNACELAQVPHPEISGSAGNYTVAFHGHSNCNQSLKQEGQILLKNAFGKVLDKEPEYHTKSASVSTGGTVSGLPAGNYVVVYTAAVWAEGWSGNPSRHWEHGWCSTQSIEVWVCQEEASFAVAPPPPPPAQGGGGGAPGSTPKKTCVCDPVSPLSGEFFETKTDMTFGGRKGSLALSRTYSSLAAAPVGEPLGKGWFLSLGAYIIAAKQGNLWGPATVTNGNGSRTVFENTTAMQAGPYISPGDVRASLVHNANGTWTYGIGNREVETFNSEGKLTSVGDMNGNLVTLTYESGHLVKATDGAGRTLTLAYNANSELASVSDSNGRVVEYHYNASKQLSEVTDVRGGKTEYTYVGGKLATEKDPRGNVVLTNTYDAEGRVKTQADALGHQTEFAYAVNPANAQQRTTTVALPNGSTTKYEFEYGYVTTLEKNATGTPEERSVTHYNYSLNSPPGEPETVVSPRGVTTKYGYDINGNVTSEELVESGGATSHKREYSYNGLDELTGYDAPSGEITSNTYDSAGNLLSTAMFLSQNQRAITSYGYNGHGDLTSKEDPLGHVWNYGVDSAGNRTSEVDPEGNHQAWGFNAEGFETSATSPRGNVEGGSPEAFTTKIEPNAEGAPTKVTNPLGKATKYVYDADGHLVEETTPRGGTTTTTYDAAGEPTKVKKPNGETTETAYDSIGQIVGQTDGRGRTTTFVRNHLGEVTEVIGPLSRKVTKGYDPGGNLIRKVDPQGRETTYKYDPENRLTEIHFADGKTPTVKYEYNVNGDPKKMIDGTGTTTYSYDLADRLIAVENGNGAKTAFAYDEADNETEITYPNGKKVIRAFDKDNRLKSATDWLGHEVLFSYNPDSRLATTKFPTATGVEDRYSYDNADLMSEMKSIKGATTLASIGYERNADGGVSKAVSAGVPGAGTTEYAYDENDRLKTVGAASYEYDAADSPTKIAGTTYTYDGAAQLEKGGGSTFAFNLGGERTGMTPSSGPASTYSYDELGSLTGVSRPAEGAVPKIADTYTYDGDGLRMSQTVSGVTNQLTWNNSESLPLLLNDGVNSYVYGPEGAPIEQISSAGVVTDLHHDQQGSTRTLTNESGVVVGTASYEPYGALLGTTGEVSPLGYDGQLTNSDSGLVYMRARTYDPKTAQFLTRDPLLPLTGQAYNYAGDNPLNANDPSGLDIFGDIGGAISGAATWAYEHPGQVAEGIAGGVCIVASDGVCAIAVGGAFGTSTAVNATQAHSVGEFAVKEGVTTGETVIIGGAGLIKTGLGASGLLDGALPASKLGQAGINIYIGAPGATGVVLEGPIDKAIQCNHH